MECLIYLGVKDLTIKDIDFNWIKLISNEEDIIINKNDIYILNQ